MHKFNNSSIGMLALGMVSVVLAQSAAIAAPSTKTTTTTTTTTTVKKNVVMPKWSVNIKVPYRSWLPRNKPSQVLLCVHGLGFSSRSYNEFGRAMAGRGFATYAMDVRGFGAWMQRKGDDAKVDFESCLSDVETALRTLRKAYPGTPVFLVGESMGGAIVLQAAARNPQLVDGIVSSVPSSDRYAKLSSELIVGMHYLEDKDKPIDLTPEVIERSTSDKELQRQFAANSSNRMKLSPKELKQFNDFMKANDEAALLIAKLPVLMIAGFKDKLVKPEGTIELFNTLSTPEKMLWIVGDGEHLLLEENQLTTQLTRLLTIWISSEAAGKTISGPGAK